MSDLLISYRNKTKILLNNYTSGIYSQVIFDLTRNIYDKDLEPVYVK